MGRGYSQDLRDKAFKFLDSGETRRSVSKRLSIHERTLGNWISRRKQTGSYAEKIPNRDACRRVLKDISKLIAYVKSNPHATQEEIGKHFGCSKSVVNSRLKEAGFSYKKNIILQRKRHSKTKHIL